MANLLIVEDEYELLQTIAETLEMAGHRCDTAPDGRVALDLFRRRGYDLILSDINMPRVSGLDLYQGVRGEGYRGPFIFITGFAVPDGIPDLRPERERLLQKPFSLTGMVGVVSDLLEGARVA